MMPGERAEFVFFEPRYLLLARRILGLDRAGTATSAGVQAAAPPDQRYAHLPEPDGIGTIASIVEHAVMPDGRIAVRCVAGPRCRATRAHLEPSEPPDQGGDEAKDAERAPSLLHVNVSLLADEPAEDEAHDRARARELFERLTEIVSLNQLARSMAITNVPPLLDAEALSFWLGNVCLRKNDAPTRIRYLNERSCRARLDIIQGALEAAASAKGQRSATS